MNIISFYVKVPVLSVKRYYILPSSSGILEFLAIVPSISLSLFIRYEYNNFAKSRLTLNEIGMTALKRIRYLKKSIPSYHPISLVGRNIIKIKAIKNIKQKSSFERKLI